MDKELNNGQMGRRLKDNTNSGKRMEGGRLDGLMEACTLESSKIMLLRVLESIIGVMEGRILGIEFRDL
eukprot:CAMPEP_0168316518 /NCGR_PEP_ID=MMETSP0210-20121227/16152_1 /TAXON_ID=40633 /ORGANISM="Condylostoma magnum, Strain COL2" /LENGTH=68 /DNA_ID=CAMNT_0008298417 /DNA_START=392 /DNA_END=598 /DNA_ORIENTATION=-